MRRPWIRSSAKLEKNAAFAIESLRRYRDSRSINEAVSRVAILPDTREPLVAQPLLVVEMMVEVDLEIALRVWRILLYRLLHHVLL